jgi:ketosteroid isomerase-like protein
MTRRLPAIAEALQGTTHTPAEDSAGNHSGLTHSCIAGHALLASVSQSSLLGYPGRMNADALAVQAVLVGPPDPEIVGLEAELRAAQLAADVAALDRLIAEELLFTGPDGKLATKAQDLAAHRSGIVRIREHEPTELRVRRIGSDVAIAALCTRLTVEIGGATVRGTYRYTRVWAREQGSWRVAGGHVAPAPEPAELHPGG